MARRGASYAAAMREALAKILLIAAVLSMPFAMAAPAAAVSNHWPAASASAHCSEEGGADRRQSATGECAMTCASALPAADGAAGKPLAPIIAPGLCQLAEPMTGFHPETATPPPRFT